MKERKSLEARVALLETACNNLYNMVVELQRDSKKDDPKKEPTRNYIGMVD